MWRIGLAFKMFFQVLFSEAVAKKVLALESPAPAAPAPAAPAPAVRSVRPVSQRSEALILLETLQREARFLDFIQEDIQSYSDQQVGSAVREVHRGCRSVLDRMFAIGPVVDAQEGTPMTVPENEAAARIRLVGKVTQTQGAKGTLVHAGWEARRCELPTWTGSSEMQRILAPAEIEIS